MVAAGVWYLLTGLVCIALGDSRALSPWAMGIPYGVGQLLVAAILLLNSREGEDDSLRLQAPKSGQRRPLRL